MEVSGSDFIDVNWDLTLRYDPETITIPANDYREIPATSSWVEFLTVTGSDNLRVSFNGKTYQPLEVGLILKAPRNKAFRRLYIANPSGVANTVKVSKGLGDFDDARLTLTPASVLNVNPLPAAYGSRYAVQAALGSAPSAITVVAAGANVNGVLILTGSLACFADPTAIMTLEDSINTLLCAVDSLAIPIGSPFTIPAGQAVILRTIGGGRGSFAYRIL